MNQSQKKVLSYLTGYDDYESVPVETLIKLVDDDPYFPVGQYLLAKKLKVEDADNFAAQAQKTALFFSNALWLDYQLNADKLDTSTATNAPIDNATLFNETNNTTEELAPVTNETLDTVNIDEILGTAEHPAGPRKEEVSDETIEIKPAEEDEIIVGVTEAQTEPLPDQLDENFEKTIHPDLEETLTEPPKETESEYNAESRTEVFEVINDQPEEEIAAITRDTDTPAEQFLEQLDSTAPIVHTNLDNIITEAPTEAQLETVEFVEEMAGVSTDIDKATETFLQEVEPITHNQQEGFDESGDPDDTDLPLHNNVNVEPTKEKPEQDEHERMFLNIKAMLDATSEEANAETKEAYVPIDPYYTIDYFASQGIKLDLDQNPSDQLGRNLKKFTQWLKHMKKLGPEDALETMKGVETESDIQQIADSSNVMKEVVTEAMALVLEKQGKKDKAIELYNKLSFLNPDKSAYFADKIKNLKGF